jgi:hypothetical protein
LLASATGQQVSVWSLEEVRLSGALSAASCSPQTQSRGEQLRETLLVSLDFAEVSFPLLSLSQSSCAHELVLQFEGGLQLAWSPTALRLAVFSGTRLKFVDIGKDSSTVRSPAA